MENELRKSRSGAKHKRQKKQKSKTPHRKRKIFKRIFLTLFGLFIVGMLCAGGLFFYYVKDAPTLQISKLIDAPSPKYYDENATMFAELGAEKRDLIEANDIPQLLKDAVVSIEDRRFYKHFGIDPIRIAGSALRNIKNKITGHSGGRQGGSTLTQQLIKLSFFSTDAADQTYRRKAQEAWLAMKLERTKSKDEIMMYYVNKVYMSNGVYGMETAAQTFYGKTLKDLSLPQIALIAGLPQAPSDYDPYIKNNDQTKIRRDTVLYSMLENEKITQSQYDAAVATPITEGLKELKEQSSKQKIIDNYLTSVIKEVKEKTGRDAYTEGMEIYTNLDYKAQEHLYNLVNSDKYVKYPDNQLQVAASIIDVKTGKIKAQIGSRKVAADVQFGTNQAVENKRDVGSTIKPLVDYGPAVEYLDYSSAQWLIDSPINYEGTNKAVQNYDRIYKGGMTMRQAIMDSRNTTAVKTYEAVAASDRQKFLNSLGLSKENGVTKVNPISADISTVNMAAAYAAYANKGIYSKPYYVTKIVYPDGTSEEFEPESKQAVKESTAYIMTDILKDVIKSGSGTAAQIKGLIQAGKTGTSNYEDTSKIKNGNYSGAPDISFSGYTTKYAISVWTGYRDYYNAINPDDQKLAALIYKEMMTFMSKNIKTADWKMPSSVVRVGTQVYVKGKTVPVVPQTPYYPPQSSTSQTETSETTETTSSGAPPVSSDPPQQSSAEPPAPSQVEPEPGGEQSSAAEAIQ